MAHHAPTDGPPALGPNALDDDNPAVTVLEDAGIAVDDLSPTTRMALEQLSVDEAHVLAQIAAKFATGGVHDLREIEGNRNF